MPTAALTYTVDGLCSATGVPRSTIYEALSCGELDSFKLGRRRMFTADAAQRWIGRHAGGSRSDPK